MGFIIDSQIERLEKERNDLIANRKLNLVGGIALVVVTLGVTVLHFYAHSYAMAAATAICSLIAAKCCVYSACRTKERLEVIEWKLDELKTMGGYGNGAHSAATSRNA